MTHKNTDQEMSQLYLDRANGKEHEMFERLTSVKWVHKPDNHAFSYTTKYRVIDPAARAAEAYDSDLEDNFPDCCCTESDIEDAFKAGWKQGEAYATN